MRSLAIMALVFAGLVGLSAPDAGAQEPISAEQIDRELIVRFARAYGMARGAADRQGGASDEADLKHPDELDEELREELYLIMDQNGVSAEEWSGMLARMEKDEALRERIESLSTPFRLE